MWLLAGFSSSWEKALREPDFLQHHMELSLGLLMPWQLASPRTSNLREGKRTHNWDESQVFLKSNLRSYSLYLLLYMFIESEFNPYSVGRAWVLGGRIIGDHLRGCLAQSTPVAPMIHISLTCKILIPSRGLKSFIPLLCQFKIQNPVV